MAIKYKLDEDARDHLDRRSALGERAIKLAEDRPYFDKEERETYARDIVSDILTALFGPAGYCVERGDTWDVQLDPERGTLASTFLSMCQESWESDAEDYTATVYTVEDEYRDALSPVEQIRERFNAVSQQYVRDVIPGVTDNSVLETERDTLQWVLSLLS